MNHVWKQCSKYTTFIIFYQLLFAFENVQQHRHGLTLFDFKFISRFQVSFNWLSSNCQELVGAVYCSENPGSLWVGLSVSSTVRGEAGWTSPRPRWASVVRGCSLQRHCRLLLPGVVPTGICWSQKYCLPSSAHRFGFGVLPVYIDLEVTSAFQKPKPPLID